MTTWRAAELAILKEHTDYGATACQRALEAAGYRRSLQSVKNKRRRTVSLSPRAWTPAQVAYLELHWDADPSSLVAELNRRGPERTRSTIIDKRRKLGLGPPRVAREPGWPKVAPDLIDQDRNYLRALLADLRQMKRSTDSSPDVYPVHGLASGETVHNAACDLEVA